jgi:Family of unknown function (DUF5335)
MEIKNEMTREVPRNEWVNFFDGFSKQHEGWQVTLQVFDADLGAQIEAENLPLRGINADLKDDEDIIEINVGETPSSHVEHQIASPTHVRLKTNAQGADEALEIETESGTATLMQFRVAAMPETVDGVVFAKQ